MMFVVIALLAIFAFLTWRNLETGVLLLCALLPSYLIRFSIMGIPTTFLEMMTLIVIGVWLVQRSPLLIEEGARGRCYTPLALPIILLLLATTIGIFVSPDKLAAIGVWKSFYVEPILLFFVVVNMLGTSPSPSLAGGVNELGDVSDTFTSPAKGRLGGVFVALGISALFVSLFGLIQFIFSIGIPAPWDLERRITSIFEYPNALALFLEPIIVISWFEIKKATDVSEATKVTKVSWKRYFWILTSVLATLNVFLAQSEAGIAALIITAVCILLFSRTTRKQTFASILIVSALVFTIPTSRNYFYEKLTFQDSSEQVRLSQWKETVELLKDHPITGVGLSGYPIALKPYHQDLQYEIFQYPHNIILNIWVELGILGLVMFGYLVFGIWKLVWNTKKSQSVSFEHPQEVSLQTILFCSIFLEILIHGLVDVPYFKNDLAMMTWILIACAVALRTNKKYGAL